MEKIGNELINSLVDITKRGLVAIIILIVGFKLVNFLLKRIKKGRGFNKLEKTTQSFLISILGILLKSIIIVTCAGELGIPMTSIITLIGSIGLALGLALQGGLSNIAGGVMIMIFKPFKVGDFIDNGTNSGTVKEINIFHTVLSTYDNKMIVIPNGNLSNSVVINYSKYPERLLDIPISVDYKSNLENVKSVLNKIALKCQYRIEDKDILVALKAHSESSLDFTFRIWVKNSDYWKARFELLEEIKKEFDKNNISIPYPQLDVHVNK
ncbi:MAG: mechanosensitive ion channel [Bacilli bacterium]|nr:mechanosensitive ion channel [Bacilli bacterium]